MSAQPPRKFAFDTLFDDAGRMTAPPRPQRSFSLEEAEALKAAAFAEGERAALASMAALQAQALASLADACRQALPTLAAVAHDNRTQAAALALACGRAIADAALERFPEAPLQAALESLGAELEGKPRLVLTCPPELAPRLEESLTQMAQAHGFTGQVLVRPAHGFGAGFNIDFGDASARFDPDEAARRVSEALSAALAAEGLHADPMIPAQSI